MASDEEATNGRYCGWRKKREKNTRKKAQKLENEGEGRRMKVISPLQEALTRKR
jgi:hypothetical protein